MHAACVQQHECDNWSMTAYSTILLHCSGEAVHENLLKHPIFAVLDVPLCHL